MERIILGIDPGTSIMGYGVLRVDGKHAEMLALGVIDLRKFTDHLQTRISNLAIFPNVSVASSRAICQTVWPSKHPSLARIYRVCSSWGVPKA